MVFKQPESQQINEQDIDLTKIVLTMNQFKQAGGMERYTFDLIDGLFEQIQQPIVVYATKIDHHLSQFTKAKVVEVPIRRIPKKLRFFFFTYWLEKMRQQNDYVIACNEVNHADVFVCGGTHLGYLAAMEKKSNWLDKMMIHRNKTNYVTAKRIMAHSRLMQKELVQYYGIDAEKISVIYPPINVEQFYPDIQAAQRTRQQYGFADDETIFLFPSTGHKRKGLDWLARFFEQTKLPVKLAVAGSPLPRPMNNVIELGFCQNMPDLYRAADFTIMASQYEPFGLVGIESVLCGTRVVLANNMGCTEVLNAEAGFFFARHDFTSLVQAVEQAVVLKNNHQHKIQQPLTALNYNPTMTHHIEQIKKWLNASFASSNQLFVNR